MATYAYHCPNHGPFERTFSLGKAPEAVTCLETESCRRQARRFFSPETLPQIAATDPFRAFDLSPRKERAQIAQQRYVDAPADRFEAKRLERDLGRIYVGDDTGGMTAAARRGIETAKEKAS